MGQTCGLGRARPSSEEDEIARCVPQLGVCMLACSDSLGSSTGDDIADAVSEAIAAFPFLELTKLADSVDKK